MGNKFDIVPVKGKLLKHKTKLLYMLEAHDEVTGQKKMINVTLLVLIVGAQAFKEMVDNGHYCMMMPAIPEPTKN